jgi:CheY-like chemotaxis protein
MDPTLRILLLDDDPDLLDMYSEILSQLPTHPQISTATSGVRAMAMLEADPFQMLICDLKMPKMDGVQVLSIVRRKYPQMRTVVLTSVVDEQFRSRVYALGVDLFWHKPATEQEITMFLECIESLLGRDTGVGFRGVQSKSLVDIIQLECISHNSLVLRVLNGPLTGRIWIQDGEVMDAEAGELHGEPAFHKILSWKAGNFETLAAEPDHSRSISKSYNALLLETVQAMDEMLNNPGTGPAGPAAANPLSSLAQIEGVEFLLAMNGAKAGGDVARGLENPDRMAKWARESLARFRSLGERLQAGTLERMAGLGPQRNVTISSRGGTDFCVGWKASLSQSEIAESMNKVLSLWAS